MNISPIQKFKNNTKKIFFEEQEIRQEEYKRNEEHLWNTEYENSKDNVYDIKDLLEIKLNNNTINLNTIFKA